MTVCPPERGKEEEEGPTESMPFFSTSSGIRSDFFWSLHDRRRGRRKIRLPLLPTQIPHITKRAIRETVSCSSSYYYRKEGKKSAGGPFGHRNKGFFFAPLSSSRFPLKNEKAQKRSPSNDDDPHLLVSPRCEETIKKGRGGKKVFFSSFSPPTAGHLSLSEGGGGAQRPFILTSSSSFPLLPLPLSTKCATDFLALVSPTFCENLPFFMTFFLGGGGFAKTFLKVAQHCWVNFC